MPLHMYYFLCRRQAGSAIRRNYFYSTWYVVHVRGIAENRKTLQCIPRTMNVPHLNVR